ncbi:hypothetical protein C6Y11_10625 [Lactiplantibacillus pentosus]|uniref:CDP-glycerol glycerophosphotransferase family protein n=1 Tax=Lactiplantibacillus pentosus TaxID=1589 RepID=UPI000D01920E|nr:CDP-glycerol glycerophosphotransferase family protein [Lactiplantibacillus pentosus]MCT3284077.1 hypothetical protein [Lactiplantibacillus pentosus]MCT3302410.1 hypothetical protein [Lactiplantibacillus pentosus]PRO76653.1 hypothetical protein C6Y09_16515 [Lactiplantibacillus pentosus]PRO78558.1 hypothetical protein C6Y11_10625 [Lactiplantibacillus pentosus]PRO89047.1 hypothetical protein C6Y12_13545 [Lactiplantibacillus pentosus]
MIKNVVLKKVLIGTVFKAVSVLNKSVPKKDNQILLYSDLGFRDNIKYLYEYLIENKYNERYEIVCAVKGYEDFEDTAPHNVSFVRPSKGIFAYLRSMHVFYCFGKLPIHTTKQQKVIQMWHGTSFKGFATNQTQTSANASSFYTYVYASSPYFKPIVERKFNVTPEHVAICGHPRTDVFYQPKANYDLGQYKKIIMWMPTFRQSKRLGQNDTSQQTILPFLQDDELGEFDSYLKQQGVKMIVKLHPMQDVSKVKHNQWQNLMLMTNEEFENSGMDLYRLLNLTDALITDYSSVFYDYLLLNRQIGFTESDVAEYKEHRGFAVDPEKFRPGMRIRTRKDLEQFIQNVISDNDAYESQRLQINSVANQIQNGTNCEVSLKLSGIN